MHVRVVYTSQKLVISILLIMESNNEVSAEVLFEYTGEGCVVPEDVTSVRFHPCVVEVENLAFSGCKQMREVMFN